MRARKRLSGKQRLSNFATGTVGIIVALLIAQQDASAWSGVIAFVVGAFAMGGIFRGLFGYDEV